MWNAKPQEIDFWKGVSLTGLTCNHLFLWPLSSITAGLSITYQSLGWFTFASIYFASAGILWGRRAESGKGLWRWNSRRAAKLLIWICAATFIFNTGIHFNLLKPAPWQMHHNWNQKPLLGSAILGLQLPWLVDVIWLHAFFGLFASALWSLPVLKNRPLIIAAVSIALWLAAQADLTGLPSGHGYLPPWHSWAGWQFLFIFAAMSQNKKVLLRLKDLSNGKAKKYILVLLLGFMVLKHSAGAAINESFTDPQKFAPLFAINSLAALSLMNMTPKINLPNCITRSGRYSLSGYSVQCALVYALGSHPLPNQNRPATALLILVCSILVLLIFSNLQDTWRE